MRKSYRTLRTTYALLLRKLFKSLEAYKSQVESENFSEGSEYYMSHIRISMRFSIFVFPARPVGGSFFQKN